MTENIYDISIIGAGPVGLYAGFYAGMRNVKTQILESLPQVGGQLATIYPDKYIYDVAGHSKVKALDLVDQLHNQVRNMSDVEIKTNEAVVNIKQIDDIYEITSTKETYRTKAVILATGSGSFNPRTLAIDYDAQLEADGRLVYHIDKLENFKNQRVAVAGGGDSAIDIAMMLKSVAEKVYIIHRREDFRALEESVRKLYQSDIEILKSYKINKLEENSSKLKLGLEKIKSDENLELDLDRLVVNYGFKTDTSHLDSWDINLDLDRNLYEVDGLMETNYPNIYAIGDGASYLGKLKLISQGFGEAPTAVNQIVEKLYPKKRRSAHSTSLFK